MKRIKQIIVWFFVSAIILFIYKNWFLSSEIIGGDWPYFYQEGVNSFPQLPPAWSSGHGNGLGGSIIVYALDSYLYFSGWIFSNIFGIPWAIVYKFFYFCMFLFLSIFSVWQILKKVFPSMPPVIKVLGVFIYAANTYILLITSGGQMGIALAYSVAPLVFIKFINLVELCNFTIFAKLKTQNSKLKNATKNLKVLKFSIVAGVVFAVQVMFDIRIAYITIGAVILYQGLSIKYLVSRKNIFYILYFILYTLVIPLGITVLLHAFWLLPLLFTGNSSVENLGNIYTTAGAVKFFSFATLENTISLLHPNWPENLFGKTYFMKAEFLLLPILAYSSLLFLNTKQQLKTKKNLIVEKFNNRTILFFTLLGLIGAFLAKGANDPFGQIYIWLFEHIPGFVMFRDPTKWYILVAVSYSVLIPFFVYSIYQWFRSKVIKSSSLRFIPNLFLILTTLYLILLVYPALSGQLSGTFQKREVPGEYVLLKDKLNSDHEFYRTLWIPRQQRFTFSTNNHPSIEAEPLFSATDSASLEKVLLKNNKTEEYLSELGVRHVVIPYDPYGEIFAEDRKYSQKKRDEYERVLDKIAWLKKIQDGTITIYETKKHRDRFWTKNGNEKVKYVMKSSTSYNLELKNSNVGDKLIFSENYNPYWKARINDKEVISKRTDNGLNSFEIPRDNKKVTIYYQGEIYYKYGLYISLVTGIILIVISLYKLRRI